MHNVPVLCLLPFNKYSFNLVSGYSLFTHPPPPPPTCTHTLAHLIQSPIEQIQDQTGELSREVKKLQNEMVGIGMYICIYSALK